ncbi:hypothetical protein [Amycolatopsis eburnea]|uniref:Uncharacterized protein n=1 Tax=Amycolatopsis eburnea TaxID=2267691 RepID=A0A3R9EVY0_9PSEU|nr:hypothetical protein [Amycolatopsis eburnea]RSD22166.1 hypothetical protein EIY87_10215 [Amycolatopsis eburnea]
MTVTTGRPAPTAAAAGRWTARLLVVGGLLLLAFLLSAALDRAEAGSPCDRVVGFLTSAAVDARCGGAGAAAPSPRKVVGVVEDTVRSVAPVVRDTAQPLVDTVGDIPPRPSRVPDGGGARDRATPRRDAGPAAGHPVRAPSSAATRTDLAGACGDVAAAKIDLVRARGGVVAAKTHAARACCGVAATRRPAVPACGSVTAAKLRPVPACDTTAAAKPRPVPACDTTAAAKPRPVPACDTTAAAKSGPRRACGTTAPPRTAPHRWSPPCPAPAWHGQGGALPETGGFPGAVLSRTPAPPDPARAHRWDPARDATRRHRPARPVFSPD